MKKIIFKNNDNTVGIITPARQALITFGIKAIAKKDTPEGLPYWIVDDSEIPTDRSMRNAWFIDDDAGEPNGIGSKSNSFEGV